MKADIKDYWALLEEISRGVCKVKNIAGSVYNKVEEVLFIDKLKSPQKIGDILSGEILYILKQYFEVNDNSYTSNIFVEKDGEMNISFSFKATRVLIKRGASGV